MTPEYILTNIGHSSMPNGRSRVGIGNLLSDMVDSATRSGFRGGPWLSIQNGQKGAGKFRKGATMKRIRTRINVRRCPYRALRVVDHNWEKWAETAPTLKDKRGTNTTSWQHVTSAIGPRLLFEIPNACEFGATQRLGYYVCLSYHETELHISCMPLERFHCEA